MLLVLGLAGCGGAETTVVAEDIAQTDTVSCCRVGYYHDQKTNTNPNLICRSDSKEACQNWVSTYTGEFGYAFYDDSCTDRTCKDAETAKQIEPYS